MADLFHPVRLRIVQALLGRSGATTSQLRAELADVPQATLYRHLADLLMQGVLVLAEPEEGTSTSERMYRLRVEATNFDFGQLADMTRDELVSAFTMFAIGLIGSFERYVDATTYDFASDGVSFTQTGFTATAEEALALVDDVHRRVADLDTSHPGPTARRRVLSLVLVPQEDSVDPV